MHLLLLEQDDELASLLVASFSRDKHQVTRSATSEDALQRLATAEIEAVLLGTEERDQDVAWCRAIRAGGHAVPILVLGAHSTVAYRVELLDAGADDVLPRPFAIAELHARIRALGRRLPAIRVSDVTCGHVRIQSNTRRAWVGDAEVTLTAREWSVVDLIVRRRGHLVSRTEILDRIWGEVTDANHASLDVIVGRIRKKLGLGFIQTLRGEGFVLR